jgi:drug/metabolite transporter (DMT)-like permease
LSLLISFAGAVLIATQGQFSDWSGLDVNGVLLALASTLVWALYWLLNTHLQIDTSIKLSVGFLSGSILTWVYILFTQEIPAVTMKLPWLAIAYVGLLEMGVTFFIWLKALQLASSAARLGQMIYLAPFFSLLSLWIFLDEEIYPSTIAGLLIIIGGIVLHRRFQAD